VCDNAISGIEIGCARKPFSIWMMRGKVDIWSALWPKFALGNVDRDD
jgi:hypothetical protein